MSRAELKGCHEVQNLGAVQTYLRRYLWTTAMEIVEHDALDATTGSVEVKPKQLQSRLLKVEQRSKAKRGPGRWLPKHRPREILTDWLETVGRDS
jgi:hypothetical protein